MGIIELLEFFTSDSVPLSDLTYNVALVGLKGEVVMKTTVLAPSYDAAYEAAQGIYGGYDLSIVVTREDW